MLVIADAEGAVGIAGVMGGENTEIRPETTDVLLEAANFDTISVRKTSRKLGLLAAKHRVVLKKDWIHTCPLLRLTELPNCFADCAAARLPRG